MKIFKTHKRWAVGGLAFAVAVFAGGVAAAWFTTTGGGTANAVTGSGSTVSINQLTNTSVLYDSLVNPLPQDMFSEAFAATGTSEFGNEVNLANSGSTLSDVTATLSIWSCGNNDALGQCITTPGATFPVPVTLTIYDAPATVGGALGSQIATATKTFNVPYRPSEDDTNCVGPNLDNPSAANGQPNGEWYNGSTCSINLNSNITFSASDFGSAVVLPGSIVYGISYPTTTTAEQSLNVAVSDDTGDPATTAITAGSDAITGDYLNSSEAVSYCESVTPGSFQYDPDNGTCTGDGNAVDYEVPTGSYDGYPTPGYTGGFDVPAVEFNGYQNSGTFTTLYPGGPSQPLDFSITNTGSNPAYVQSVTVTLTGSNQPGCDLNWFSIVQPSSPNDVTIPVGATVNFQPSGGSVSLVNYPTNQDSCENAVLDFSYTAN